MLTSLKSNNALNKLSNLFGRLHDVTEASSCIEHGKLPQDVARSADANAECGYQVERLQARADPNLDEKFDPTCDRCQPKVQRPQTINLLIQKTDQVWFEDMIWPLS